MLGGIVFSLLFSGRDCFWLVGVFVSIGVHHDTRFLFFFSFFFFFFLIKSVIQTREEKKVSFKLANKLTPDKICG